MEKKQKVKLKYIENVEGAYHLVFLEGRKIMEGARADIRNACFSLLFFTALLVIFVMLSGFNMFYLYFFGAFLILFIIMMVIFNMQRHEGKKQCIYAVMHSKNTDIVNKPALFEKQSKVFVESMSSTLDKYDTREKFPGVVKKYVRKKRHSKIASKLKDIHDEDEK